MIIDWKYLHIYNLLTVYQHLLYLIIIWFFEQFSLCMYFSTTIHTLTCVKQCSLYLHKFVMRTIFQLEEGTFSLLTVKVLYHAYLNCVIYDSLFVHVVTRVFCVLNVWCMCILLLFDAFNIIMLSQIHVQFLYLYYYYFAKR